MSLTASAYFSRIVTRPLRELASAARGLSAGDGSAAAGIARISQDDELGDLARDFLNMSRKLAAKIDELEGTRAYLDDVINTLPSALMTVDDAGRVTRWNAAAAAMAGDAMAPGRAAWEALPLLFPLREALLGAITARRAEDLPEQRTESRSFSPRSSRHIAVSVFPLGRAAGEAAVIRLDDVTEITRKEAELRQIQKMEMLGTLSMGIAHDFNNVLMGIVGTASILSLRLEESDCGEAAELAAEARSILSIAERAKDLVRQISRISRREELSLALIDLRSSLASVMKMCASSFDKSIAISLSQPPGAAMVMADAVLIEQVILNVCVNAAHAMTIMRPPEDRQGGRLEVSLTRAEADAHFLSAHALASQGAYWILRVADSGVGMDKDTLERIFDPFFTTKGPGRGSGMGLAMAYSIVRQHGGFIEAYSELGAGSVFSVYLKEAEGKDQVRSDQADTGIIKGSGSILVVDDEETVRRVAKGMLEACGYKAILASGLPEAEAALSDPETPPRAAIIDMSMPGTSGDEVLAALRSLSPELIAFISSGYRHDPRIDKALNTGAAGFIQKPYTLSELSHALARALGQERA
jgi:signal transduction histidine kinase/CheY-like chemotaxis protein